LVIALKNLKIKLNRFIQLEKAAEQLTFICNLALTKPKDLHDILLVKLETIFAQILLQKHK
jgi:hypothetical protein